MTYYNNCPRYKSLCVMAMIKGSFLQPLLKKQGLPTACKSYSSIDSTSCGHQAPVGSRQEAGNEPIRLVLRRRTISKAHYGWFVKTELDFKPSWDKYYLFFFFSKALISALEIVQPFNGSLSSVPYKDFV